MTLAITFGDTNISKWLDGILLVTRNVGQNRVPQLDQIGLSDGKMLSYIRADEGTIVVTAIVRTNVTEKRRLLADALTTSTPTKLIFADEPDIYYNAISTGQITLDEAYLHNTLTITFTVPDGIAHSVATQTFNNMPYKDVPVNLLTNSSTARGWNNYDSWTVADDKYNGLTVFKKNGQWLGLYQPVKIASSPTAYTWSAWVREDDYDVQHTSGLTVFWNALDKNGNTLSNGNTVIDSQVNSVWNRVFFTLQASSIPTGTDSINIRLEKVANDGKYLYVAGIKIESGDTASPWSPNPADPEYYTDTITVHNGGTYPVEPVITATMHADNGMVGIVNDRPGILQFGTQEIDGFTTEESEVALDLAAVQGSHMDNQAATNNPYWGGDPSMPNEQIGNAIWTHDDYDGWKVEPNWPSITGDHKYWNGPSIKHNLAQTHNGNFKSNLTWDVMTRFQTGVAQVGALETTLESDGKPIFQMILKDNSALSDQIWWMCYYKGQLVVNEQLDRSIFTNDKFIQLELQKFGNSVVFRASPWVGNQGRETTITRQFTFADAADVETKQFSTWFMRDKTWGESTMYLIASTVKWQNVSWYTNIKNRFSNGDVLKIDVANAKTYLNGSLDPTMHTIGNQWEQFKLPPGDTEITITPSSWAQPFACEVEIREAWL
ncbi:distal tail protein Dit [Lacticaseibacillus paracasei]|uniref:Phage tail protein n=1 Tax=Lacticaseibacillus paracasei N1115 TaxID=1446494 RepID=A0A806LGS1_LACPA|nr:distal tail protein Dit [Lacticaseibacillus paracasei]AHJ33668.1 phage tail protein [Lacticaseibacillus paracasei N1115]